MFAAKRIKAFMKTNTGNLSYKDEHKVGLGLKFTQYSRLVFMPGGKATYPSSVLMTATLRMLQGKKKSSCKSTTDQNNSS